MFPSLGVSVSPLSSSSGESHLEAATEDVLLVCVDWVTLRHVPASPLDISVGPEIQVMCLGLQPFDPQGINSSWGIGCKHNGIRHPARSVCCTAPLRCDIHAYCCWDIYWIKADDVVLYCFSQLKRQNTKPGGALRRQKLVFGVCISQTERILIPDHYPDSTSPSVSSEEIQIL